MKDFRTLRILVVDDDPVVADSLRRLLMLDGHFVHLACNGNDALDLFYRNQFDLVITDFAMSGMNGSELIRVLTMREPTVPVIMLTAFEETLRRQAPHSVLVIGKPVDLDSLRFNICKVMSWPSRTR